MNQKHYEIIFHANINVNLTEQNVIQIDGGITISVNLCVKKHHISKKVMFRILVQVIVKMEII